MNLDFAAINAALNADDVVPEWLPRGKKQGREWVSTNPNRADRSPGSFSVNLATGRWADFASNDTGGDLVSLYAYLKHHGDQGAAARDLIERYGLTIDGAARERVANDNVRKLADAKPEPIFPVPEDAPPAAFKHFKFGEPTGVWTYRDAKGATLLHVCRYDPEGMRKQVVPLTWCHDPKAGKDRWAWRGITKGKRPLYGLDRLAADLDADAVLVEGEKATDAARAYFDPTGAIACSWLGGVESADKVQLKALAGRRVILWPDFDAQRVKLTPEEEAAGVDPESKPYLVAHEQPGLRAMLTIAQALKGVAREVLLVGYRIGEFEHGWDLADAKADGWDGPRVMQYMATHARDPFVQPADDEPADRVPMDAIVNPFNYPHVSDKGAPLNTDENLSYILRNYGIGVRYNAIAKEHEIDIPGEWYRQPVDYLARMTSLCARNRMPAGSLREYIGMIGGRNEYNPAAEWIDSKPWDGVDRIGPLVDTLDPTDRDLALVLLRRWMIGAAGCVYEPSGMAMQGVLVLQGQQYSGKTTWFWSLTNRNRKLAKEGASLNPGDRDSVKQAVSYWLVELGEVDATFSKADIAALKAFITKDQDELRLPFAPAESKYPRRTAFLGTVNPKQYLHDDTGNRRYWTIAHGPNLRGLHDIDMQQAWAQAKALWAAGERHPLTREEMERLNAANGEHEETNPIEELIATRFKWGKADMYPTPMTATDVLLVIGYDRPTSKQAKECGAILRRLAGEPRRSNGRQVFAMPPRASSGEPPL